MKAAKDMCESGIQAKFQQNKKGLISTQNQMLVESSKDHYLGTRIVLYDELPLYKPTWYSQGLLGKILEETRCLLINMKVENELEEMQVTENRATGGEYLT